MKEKKFNDMLEEIFRIIKDTDYKFYIIVGENGSGKTSLIEHLKSKEIDSWMISDNWTNTSFTKCDLWDNEDEAEKIIVSTHDYSFATDDITFLLIVMHGSGVSLFRTICSTSDYRLHSYYGIREVVEENFDKLQMLQDLVLIDYWSDYSNELFCDIDSYRLSEADSETYRFIIETSAVKRFKAEKGENKRKTVTWSIQGYAGFYDCDGKDDYNLRLELELDESITKNEVLAMLNERYKKYRCTSFYVTKK